MEGAWKNFGGTDERLIMAESQKARRDGQSNYQWKLDQRRARIAGRTQLGRY